jgi:hypothetical protein
MQVIAQSLKSVGFLLPAFPSLFPVFTGFLTLMNAGFMLFLSKLNSVQLLFLNEAMLQTNTSYFLSVSEVLLSFRR